MPEKNRVEPERVCLKRLLAARLGKENRKNKATKKHHAHGFARAVYETNK